MLLLLLLLVVVVVVVVVVEVCFQVATAAGKLGTTQYTSVAFIVSIVVPRCARAVDGILRSKN